jgi:hypothetical protein
VRTWDVERKYDETTINQEQDARATSYLMNCAENQAFFLTVSGCIGLAENNIQSGDHIVIVAGNSHPVVLRPHKTYADTWHAVSECHMNLWMHGQAVEWIDTCNTAAANFRTIPAIEAIRGRSRNPLWSEVNSSSLEKGWSFLLIE